MAKLRILLGDDHTMVRQGLCKILNEQPEWEVVAQAADGRDAVKQTLEIEPDVTVLDIAMPLLSGIEATRQIHRRLPNLRILILSMHAEEAYVTQALKAGATGYVLKDSADTDLITAITAVASGKSYFSPAIARVMLDDYVRQLSDRGIVDRYDALSEREREVLQLIAEGHTNKGVADLLSISLPTVETHRAHILQKLDVHNTAELVLYAVRLGRREVVGVTHDETRALLRRHKDALNRHDVEALMRLYDNEAVVTSPMFQTVRGHSAIADTFRRLFTLWPDYRIRVDEGMLLSDGDRAAEFGSVVATHSAELFGLPPTGERIEYDCVRVYVLRGGRIADERRMYDLAGILERIDRSRLERELNLAATLQRLLLPRTRQSGPYFEAVGASLPSRTVGGDFFEYVELPSGAFGVALGDASGKGAAAALMAAMSQGIFSVEADAERSPSTTLTRVNRALKRRGMEPHFTTLVYGVLSPDGGFRYSCAGQHPPLLVTQTGLRSLTAGGPMLGLFDDPAFPEEAVRLAPGDSVLLVSDGVTEAMNDAGEEFQEMRLSGVVANAPRNAPDALLDAVFDGVRQFCDGVPQSDDATGVVLQYRGPA